MLRPLILLLLFFAGGYFVFSWLRRNRSGELAAGAGRRLESGELKELGRRARRSERLSRALTLRNRIQEALVGRKDRAGLGPRVDAAIRRMAEQEALQLRIREAVEQSDGDLSTQEDMATIEERQAMLSRLGDQARSLEKEGERTLLELSNLHLAILDLSASEAVQDGGALGEALSELESEGEAARHSLQAEAEVNRFLASRRS